MKQDRLQSIVHIHSVSVNLTPRPSFCNWARRSFEQSLSPFHNYWRKTSNHTTRTQVLTVRCLLTEKQATLSWIDLPAPNSSLLSYPKVVLDYSFSKLVRRSAEQTLTGVCVQRTTKLIKQNAPCHCLQSNHGTPRKRHRTHSTKRTEVYIFFPDAMIFSLEALQDLTYFPLLMEGNAKDFSFLSSAKAKMFFTALSRLFVASFSPHVGLHTWTTYFAGIFLAVQIAAVINKVVFRRLVRLTRGFESLWYRNKNTKHHLPPAVSRLPWDRARFWTSVSKSFPPAFFIAEPFE